MIVSNLTTQNSLQLQQCAREERKGARRSVNFAGGLVFASIALMYGIQIVLNLVLQLNGALGGSNSILLEYLSSCISYLFLALIPIAYALAGREPADQLLPFQKPQTVGLTNGDLLLLGAVGMALTLASNYPTELVRMLQQAFGFSGNIPDMPLNHSIGTQVFYLIYGTVIPPLVEEILFRGVVIGCLQRWGDWFAIVTSALLFGLYHGNVGQFVFATLVGLIFGYLRIRTQSLLPGMVLHMLNNGFATLGTVITQNFGSHVSNIYFLTYFTVFYGAAALLIVFRLFTKGTKSFANLKIPYRRMASTLAARVRGLVTSFGGIAMLAYGAILSVIVLVRS
ncbi:MAG TPA: hypothetical protein DHW78_09995 [Ruminococcaceae bacterium]|jgi:membrane protease YdiL (CAAX protease family)|nr:hypothetical protein [Oscillospiraceae bacterium]